MKLRYDFVSNSSSSSFIVKGDNGDVKLLIQKVSEMFQRIEPPWCIDDRVQIEISTKNKWYREVFKRLKPETECDFKMWYEDWQTHERKSKDPEDIGWEAIAIDFKTFMTLGDYGVEDKISQIRFKAYDENNENDNALLAKLFRFFDALDCNPDESDTERDFLHDEEDREKFFEIMSSVTAKRNRRKESRR